MAFQTLPQGDQKGDRPWWLIAFVVLAISLGLVIFVSDLYAQVFNTVVKGLGVTVFLGLLASGFVMGAFVAMSELGGEVANVRLPVILAIFAFGSAANRSCP